MVFIYEIIKHLFCPIGKMLIGFNFLYTNLIWLQKTGNVEPLL